MPYTRLLKLLSKEAENSEALSFDSEESEIRRDLWYIKEYEYLLYVSFSKIAIEIFAMPKSLSMISLAYFTLCFL